MEEWDIRVPILKNRLIVQQLLLAIGLPFGLLMIVLALVRSIYGLLMVFVLLTLTALVVGLVFRGTYDVHYRINETGISCQNQEQQARRVKKLSVAAFWMGLFSGNPSAAGAGLLSGSRVKTSLTWGKIRSARYLDRQRCILVRAGFGESIAVFCDAENYPRIKAQFLEKLSSDQHGVRS